MLQPLPPAWKKNDKKAKWLIITFSIIVFLVISSLSRVKLDINAGFDVHIFAKANAIINSIVAILLLAGLIAVKAKKYIVHKRIMLTAMGLSVLFLVSYICHHLFAGEAKFGGDPGIKTIYLIILFTHIPLAGLILPFILFSAYRALIGEYDRHKKLVRITWPIWFYVAVTGVVVYLMISPYYT
jgi:putative membrane protein